MMMSNENQPFTEQITQANRNATRPGRNNRLPWVLTGLLTAALIAALLLWANAEGKVRTLKRIQSDLDAAKSGLETTQAEDQKDKDQIATLQTQVADLQKERDAAAQNAKGLEDEMRSSLESRDVTISKLQGKLTVTILDRVMFDSGDSVLKPAGESVMRKIAEFLTTHPTLKIHVIGHTDNVPIHGRFASNWELSAARALAAVHFLTEKAGVDPRRVGAVGYGEFRPIADNATAEGRAKNRRIAITILSDEMAGADTANGNSAPGTANPPPSKPDSAAATQPPTAAPSTLPPPPLDSASSTN